MWVVMEASGRWAPLDEEPSPEGTFEIIGAFEKTGKGSQLVARYSTDMSVERHMSHFVTCPDQGQWRRT